MADTVKVDWSSVFDTAAHDIGGEKVLAAPGPAGLHVLFASIDVDISVEQIDELFAEREWVSDRSLTQSDFMECVSYFSLNSSSENMQELGSEGLPEANALHDKITQRGEQRAFPLVYPHELQCEDARATAIETMELVQAVGHAEVQPYIEQEWAAFRSTCATDDGVPEVVRYHRFIESTYYTSCVKFCIEKSLHERRFCHRFAGGAFLPLIPMASIGEASKKIAAQEVVNTITLELLPQVDRQLWQGWDAIAKYAVYTNKTEGELFDKFVRSEYFDILVSVAKTAAPPGCKPFRPRYSIKVENAGDATQNQRQELIAIAVHEDEEETRAQLEADWEAELNRLPREVRSCLGADARETFCRSMYFDALGKVVKKRRCSGNEAERECVVPKVDPKAGASVSAAEVQRRTSLVARMNARHCSLVDSEVEAMWQAQVASIGPAMKAFVPANPPDTFWEEHYYSIAFRLVDSVTPPGGRPDRSSFSSEQQTPSCADAGAGMNFLMSGAAYTGDAPTTSNSPAEFMGSLQLMSGEFPGNRWKYEGVFLECDQEPRSIAPREGARSLTRRKPNATIALDMMLADNTGPVHFTLWDDAAHTMLELLGSLRTAGQQKLIVCLENLRVAAVPRNEWNGAIVTNLKWVHSVMPSATREGTSVSLPAAPSSPFMTDAMYRVPPSNVAVHQFAAVRAMLIAPFKGTFVGTITGLGGMDESQQGQPKRYFELVDDAGSWLKCTAMGRNALHRALQDGLQVVMYSCSGRPAAGSSEATLMLLKDAVIVSTGVRKANVVKRNLIDISPSQ